jgi:hypothetical protein
MTPTLMSFELTTANTIRVTMKMPSAQAATTAG